MNCLHLEEHMDQIPLSGAIPTELERHLGECPHCHETVTKWQLILEELRELDRDLQPPRQLPIRRSTRELVERAAAEEAAGASPRRLTRAFAIAASIALLASASAFFFLRSGAEEAASDTGPPPPEKALLFAGGTAKTAEIDEINELLRTANGGRAVLHLNDDAVGIDQSSRLEIEAASPTETRLRLDAGRVVCRVSHRRQGESFEVLSGTLRVRVVGTQFSVSRRSAGQIEVAVWEGEVEVSRDAHQWRVRPGFVLAVSESEEPSVNALSQEARAELEQLFDPDPSGAARAVAMPPLTSNAPDSGEGDASADGEESSFRTPARSRKPRSRPNQEELETWRSWILEGRSEEARGPLQRHLKSNPKDVAAWSLLADCERKTKRWSQAVASYREIIANGRGGEKRRAQFRAGSILQDQLSDPTAAAALFEQYITAGDTSASMEAEAMVRLARAYLALGKRERSRVLLETVTRDHQGTTAATKAKRLLQSLE